MPAKSQTLSKKVNQIHKGLKSLTRRFETSHNSLKRGNQNLNRGLQGLKKRQQGFDKRQQRFEKRQQGFEKKLEHLIERQNDYENDFKAFWEKMLALHNQEARKAEQDRLKSQKVIDQIYTIADRITKYFDDFNVEKLALGARDDRIENRVESLEESDLKQNHTIEKLDTRLTYLEARQPD
ncbi:hypothetical protein EDS67_16495 [candidate division KSB1 bacterium]|nr:MAG: hypothetical protein EDS67_16495 [candidate division KSB1 bacterium]MBC6946819.1 hypothetical protein [candidate division KSB1 bacterium]MCE7942916.1 hypothetical protein [Chlorobi bacterium CHB1]MDL1873723.1 hypothetical protein [Cytophagia bacterium CHB2]